MFLQQTIATVISTVAIIVMFQFKSNQSQENLYTTHSWVGFASFILFGLQAIAGLVAFWTPMFSLRFKQQFVVVHRAIGTGLLVGTTAAMVSGLLDYDWISEVVWSTAKQPIDHRGTLFSGGNVVILFMCLNVAIIFAMFRNPPLPHDDDGAASVQATESARLIK